MRKLPRLAVLAAMLGAAGAAGAALNYVISPVKAPAEGGFFGQSAIELPDVTLIDQKGVARRLRQDIAAGALVVVNFNYTTCQSICPTGNALMQVIDSQAPQRLHKPVKLLSITIDPQTDTPKIMRKAAAEFAPSDRWLWLTGEPGAVQSVLASAGASVPDITLHAPLFLVGDAERGTFYSIRSQPEADAVINVLNRLGS